MDLASGPKNGQRKRDQSCLGEHQASISQETFGKAQSLLQQNGRNSDSVGCNKHDPLLQGILQ